jgi:hypothetical protein
MTDTETITEGTSENPVTSAVARLSVVIGGPGRRAGHPEHGHPEATIEALAAQTGSGPIEILLVANGAAEVDEQWARRRNVRIVPVDEDATYYEMKNAGGSATTTEFVAFTDVDCVPGPEWAAAALAALESGADVVTGRSRYAGPGRWANIMGFFDLGVIGRRSDGSATLLMLHNMAFRRQAFLTHQLDTRSRRSGGCYLVTERLRADNLSLAFVPEMAVTHENDYRDGMALSKRLRNGHDAAALFRLDDTGLLPYRWIAPLGPFGAPLVAGKRIWDDWVRLWRRHGELDISIAEIPLVALLSIPLRLIEGGAYALSSVRPSIIGKYWG